MQNYFEDKPVYYVTQQSKHKVLYVSMLYPFQALNQHTVQYCIVDAQHI